MLIRCREGGHGRSGRTSRLAPTDSHNPMFEELIRARDPAHPRHDRLKEQRVRVVSFEFLNNHGLCVHIC